VSHIVPARPKSKEPHWLLSINVVENASGIDLADHKGLRRKGIEGHLGLSARLQKNILHGGYDSRIVGVQEFSEI